MRYSDDVADAFKFAFELHRSQTRKGSEVPYVTHLMGVASLVGENGGNSEQVIAALLHDAVEDQGGQETLERIRTRFGEKVASYVAVCSDSDTCPKPPWQERKQAYLRAIAAAPPGARLIVAADKLHNARSITSDLKRVGNAVWRRFQGGRDGTLWYHGEIVYALSQGWPHPILNDLADAVDALHRTAHQVSQENP